MKMLISGSLAYDKIMNFPGKFADHILPDKIHNLNVSFLIQNIKENFGGTAGNIAYNLAMLDIAPTILATAGSDFVNYRIWLEKFKINAQSIKTVNGELTAFANIMTDQSDNQLTAFYPGAMSIDYDLEVDTDNVALAIIAPGNANDMLRLADLYSEKGVDYMFDPGQQIPALSAEQLQKCLAGAKYFISNDYELSLVLQKTNLKEDELLEQVEAVITTLGEKGSQIKTKKMGYTIRPAKPENTSDPTGAGDAYRAGFIKGLVSGWPLETCGQFAGTVSVYTVEVYGTQTHRFTLEQIAERYSKNFNEKLPL